MDFGNNVKSQLEMSRSVHDLNGLDALRTAAKGGDKDAALQEAAKQFEAIFVRMLLKSMRNAQEAIADKDSIFNSEQVKFYRDMHDQQLATDLSTNGSLGLADIIVQQMSPGQGYLPAEALRNDGQLPQRSPDEISRASETASQPSKQAAFDSPKSFIESLLPKAKEAAEKLGIEVKALLSQAALETGWGKYVMHNASGDSANNLFGIKADSRWKGPSVSVDTIEFNQNVAQRQKANFREYADFAESLNDYVEFVKNNPRYERAVEQTDNPQAYFEELQKAGYATDPEYAKKVMSVYSGSLMSELLP